ncbi:conserved repeat domain-containing protein [Monaibacterium marinum]|uniref:Conserved repeat domain-containing protein n=1 Tax=Pontivivens marinum TaxID=1690039 RepID=A0A2C9CSW1_9RHOB|nr:hypothetical protein [Monaibacterium marinum]SOH94347.1 conserved repeat domain-containing protein [Monaibacterium marinum]
MNISLLKRPLLAATAVIIISTAQGGHAQGLESQFAFQIVEIAADGTETLVDRSSVYPGEVIEYAVSHMNNLEDDLNGLTFLAPVPNGVTLEFGSEFSSLAASFEIQAEMDPMNEGLEWSAVPASRIVIAEDGTQHSEPVPADAVQAVRWNLESALKSGESALNTYRVVVN